MDAEENSMRTVKSADRVLDVFELFARSGRELSHTQIAEQLGIPKSSLSQLLATLVARKYLDVSPDKRNYSLGSRLLALVRRKAAAEDMVSLARPILRSLTEACGESSALNVLAEDEAVVVCAEMAPARLVSHMREGDKAPLYATSGGKIFLAYMASDALAAYLERVQLRRVTPNTLSSKAVLKAQIRQIQQDGTAFSHEEFTLGIVGMARSVADAHGEVIGALNVAMPAVRFTPAHRERVVAHLTDAARILTGQLALI